MICDCAKLRANDISKGCGLEKIYDIDRDFPGWTSLIGGTSKNNFFEIRLNTSYKSTTSDADIEPPKNLDDIDF